jgi:hypothetical protein
MSLDKSVKAPILSEKPPSPVKLAPRAFCISRVLGMFRAVTISVVDGNVNACPISVAVGGSFCSLSIIMFANIRMIMMTIPANTIAISVSMKIKVIAGVL